MAVAMSRRIFVVIVAAVVLMSCNRSPSGAKSQTIIDKPVDLTKKKLVEKTPTVPPFIDGSSIGPKLAADGTVMGEIRVFRTTDKIYFTMRFHDSPKGLVATIVISDLKYHPLYREERPMNGTKVVTFTVPPKKLKPGRYRLEGFWGGNVAIEYEIEIK
jgi:hypothetical protein